MIRDITIDWTYFNSKSGIYKITNIVNGKLYIGATSNFCSRFHGHNNEIKNDYIHNPHLRSAYKKYGVNKFVYKPILACELDELDRYEIALIKLYKTQDRKIGYNVTPGGKRICGKDHPMFGKKQTPEWIAMISKRMSGKNNPFYGKISDACANARNEATRISVIQMDKQGNFIKEFKSIMDAAKEVGVHKSNIARVVKGVEKNRKTAGGYVWQYSKNNKAKILAGG
jgi:group I intron endonuclease